MTFSFNLTGSGFSSDKDRVRFHTGDFDPASPKWSDELIIALIADQGDWKKVVIMLLTDLLLKLAQPDFKADWLEVSNQKAAADSISALLAVKRKEFGISANTITASFVNVYRADSLLVEPPLYLEARDMDGLG